MARLTITLLGGFEGRLEGGRPLVLSARKAWALLAYLALHPGQTQPRDKLTALLWGGVAETRARASLRQALFTLRQALGDSADVLVLESEHAALDAQHLDVDALRLERALGPGSDDGLEAAVALYRGDLLAGLTLDEPPFEEWLIAERERLRELVLEGLARLIARQRAAGHLEAGVDTALRLLAIDPLQEPVHRTLMRLYAVLGRRGDALRQYRECVAVLGRELEVEPEAETRQLYQEILRERLGRPSRPDREPMAVDVPGASRRDVEPIAPALTEVPLVGRAAELDLLQAALDTAWTGQPRLFLVRGEAGIGKSRLIAEGATEAVRRGGRVLVGQCHESDQALPFGPWVDLLRTALAELGPELAGLAPAWRVELARLVPELSDVAASSPEGPAHHRRLFEAVAAFADTLARSRPLVLVLEDLHWADEPSLRLAVSLGRRLGVAPVLVVASVREEELADTPARARVLDLVTEAAATVSLGPLSRPDTTRLVAALGRRGADATATSRLANRVWAVSEGHPLMAVEATRAFGAEPDASVAEADAPGVRRALPERIHDLVMRRLRRVSDAGRAVLAVAAVAGRQVDFAVLQQAAAVGEAEAAAAVEELVRRRLLREVGDGLALAHDRVRDVVYGTLLGPRRRLLHRRIAEALEAKVGGRIEPLALGLHFEAAEVWDKATRYLRQAGLDAAARGSSREAAQSLERALGAADRLPAGRARLEQLIDLRLDLRVALAPLGEVERILRFLEEARSLATTLGDARRGARVDALMSYCFHWMGQPARGVESARRAVTIASELDDRSLAVEANYYLGQTAIAVGRFHDALEAQRNAIALLEGAAIDGRSGIPYVPAVACRVYLGLSLGFLGEFAEAGEAMQQAVRLAESQDHVHTRAFALQGSGWLALIQGEPLGAIPPLERALEISTKLDNVAMWPVTATMLGWAYALTGRTLEGIDVVEDAEQRSARLRLEFIHAGALAALSEAYLVAGRPADAQAASQRALDAARAHQQRWHEAEALRVRGDIAAAGAAGPDADSWYEEALKLASTLGMASLVARCRFARAMLRRRAGREDDAGMEMEAARQAFRRMGMTTWLERAAR
jgi:DNA-binding SARP family transcriptional activator/tetratricopeptide (TPR) repeat protein